MNNGNGIIGEAVSEAIEKQTGTGVVLASHVSYNGNSLRTMILPPDFRKNVPGDSDYGLGFTLLSDEVGRYPLEFYSSLFRWICFNGTVWGRVDNNARIHQKHIGNFDIRKLQSDIKVQIKAALVQSGYLLDAMILSKEVKVEKQLAPKIAAFLSADSQLTHKAGQEWTKTLPKYDANAFGMVNALTEAAQAFEGETRSTMEELAGAILTPRLQAPLDDMQEFWAKHKAQAAKAKEETIQQYVYAGR